MSYISDRVQTILAVLGREKIRCTYGALADYIGANAKDVSVYLAPKRAEASWIVSKKTKLPTGYEAFQLHPDLESKAEVIESKEALQQLLDA